ncbi:hypothetical protein NOSIN_00115 [Nocardiopsis sinuspersici]|uniref:AAA+ ATPase domain-containing protein n=2 Tax=Nocardiopsidaceae TaxID=83676 RepID=A0A1V3BUV7_9ACTN|nr:hypothetical protein NOSIN_00115 [Nocardiopsis sinuspersici]
MDTGDLVATLEHRAKRLYTTITKSAERTSWSASIKTVTAVLLEAGLDDVLVLLEMSTLISHKRIDMVLLGSHPRTGTISLVIVENKQWSWMRPNTDTGLVDHPGSPAQGSLHPLDQAWDYGMSLARNLPMLSDNWTCVANLHNAPPEQITSPALPADIDPDRAKMFGAGPQQRRDLAEFLASVISGRRATTHLRALNAAHVRPTDELMRSVPAMVRSRGAFFPLLDEQREAFRRIAHVLDQKFTENDKNVFIVIGGPGTGKSVLALELLGHFNHIGSAAVHASGSSAFAKALRSHVAGARGEAEEIFTYFNQHRHRIRNQLNVLLCDESHRLRKDSNGQYMAREYRSNTPQVHELIDAARVPVFFLDPYQVVRRDEVGTPETIQQAAIQLGIREDNIHQIDLKTQFRQSSCPEYLDWLEDLLGYRDAAPGPWGYQGPFQLLAADNPAEMEAYLRLQVARGRTARMVAGYCWPWTKRASPDGGLVEDIKIDDWECAWNSHAPRKGIPGADTWATDPRGLDQVGCIYTAQGLEWDYCGVIMGHDYTWAGSGWRVQRGEDRMIWGDNLHAMVRNIYRVLATRGRDGTVLYSTNATTRQLLTSLGVPPLAPALKRLKEQNPNVAVRRRAQRLTLF